jgi:purine-binding chemotaxis protein CheW
LIVDEVSEVLDIKPENISGSRKLSVRARGGKFIKGIGKVDEEVKIILDIEKIPN